MRKVTDQLKLNIPVQFRVRYKGDRKRYHQAAKRRGMNLSFYIRWLIDADIAKQEQERAE